MEEITLHQFNDVMDALERGEIRVAEKVDGRWVVNVDIKQVILAGFRLSAPRFLIVHRIHSCHEDHDTDPCAFSPYTQGPFVP